MCDGREDCPAASDETAPECLKFAQEECVRRVYMSQERYALPLPMHWVMDGEVDCENGIDEKAGEPLLNQFNCVKLYVLSADLRQIPISRITINIINDPRCLEAMWERILHQIRRERQGVSRRLSLSSRQRVCPVRRTVRQDTNMRSREQVGGIKSGFT